VRSSTSLILTAIVLALGVSTGASAGPEDSLQGPVTRGEYEAALRFFGPDAERGDRAAQYNLGRLYSQGRGAAPDVSLAIVWFRKAADQGDARARARLDALLAPDAGAAPAPTSQRRFSDVMNSIFGPGRWRETGGYRTVETENRLRAEGALTVPPGVVSRHSMGTPAAPGAYDIVVAGMSPGEAAGRIRRSGVVFRRLFPESAHGDQGPHLHVEPVSLSPSDGYPGQSPGLAAGARKTSS
jgi:hypothetical protein